MCTVNLCIYFNGNILKGRLLYPNKPTHFNWSLLGSTAKETSLSSLLGLNWNSYCGFCGCLSGAFPVNCGGGGGGQGPWVPPLPHFGLRIFGLDKEQHNISQ